MYYCEKTVENMCGSCGSGRETETKEKNIFTTLQKPKLLPATKTSVVNVYNSTTTFFIYLRFFSLFTPYSSLHTPITKSFSSISLSSYLSAKTHGSGGAQPTSHRSERARRSGHRQVGHGPEAHGRPIHSLPHLQRNRSSHMPLFALVRRRRRMLHVFRVGSHGLQQLRRLRHRSTLAGQNRDSPSQPPLLIPHLCF